MSDDYQTWPCPEPGCTYPWAHTHLPPFKGVTVHEATMRVIKRLITEVVRDINRPQGQKGGA